MWFDHLLTLKPLYMQISNPRNFSTLWLCIWSTQLLLRDQLQHCNSICQCTRGIEAWIFLGFLWHFCYIPTFFLSLFSLRIKGVSFWVITRIFFNFYKSISLVKVGLVQYLGTTLKMLTHLWHQSVINNP